MKPKKNARKTFIREVVMNPKFWGKERAKKDRGIGPGVLYRDEMTYTDINGRGFNSPIFEAEIMHESTELLDRMFIVRYAPQKTKKPKRTGRNA